MKFKIRYADQIVGTLAIAALVALAVVVILLGSKQRWFARDYAFKTTFASASGITPGMPLVYRGFTIGKITSIALNDQDEVDASFVVFDTYYGRAKEGSLVELVINPIGLGNQFLFHPGNGTALLTEGTHVPRVDSPEGRELIDSGLAKVQKKDDTITNLIAQINPLLTNINDTLGQLNGAFRGTGKGPLADTMKGVAATVTEAGAIAGSVNRSLDGLLGDISQVTANVRGITENLETLSAEVSNPDGLVPRLVDPDGRLFGSIGNSLESVEATLSGVAESADMLKSQVPQIAGVIEELRMALVQGQDVLEAVKNNPLLKGGVSPRAEPVSSGSGSRAIEF